MLWPNVCALLPHFRRTGLERYYCRIKTGNASFERSQSAAMKQLEREKHILKIRVLIEELADYSL